MDSLKDKLKEMDYNILSIGLPIKSVAEEAKVTDTDLCRPRAHPTKDGDEVEAFIEQPSK